MSDTQLAGICLNEMEFMNSSILIGMVLKNSELWTWMNRALSENQEVLYQEKTAYHIAKLQKIQKDYTQFLILVSEFPLINQFATKGVIVNELTRLFERLPEFLQMNLATTLSHIQYEFRKWQRRYSIELEEHEKCDEKEHFSFEKSHNNLPRTIPWAGQTKEHEIDGTDRELHEKISADKILWAAITSSQKEELPLEDLFILKEFYDHNRMLHTDNCRRALKRFYKDALRVRLSDISLTEQNATLQNGAHKAFDLLPQSDVLSEAIKMIDVLYGKERKVKLRSISRTLFFSWHESSTLSSSSTNNLKSDLSM